MIVPLDLPSGAHRMGTEYQSRGRWRDTHLVRWKNGAMLPVRGWVGFTAAMNGLVDSAATQVRVCGAMAWTDNSGNIRVIWGTPTYNGVMSSAGVTTDLTPGGGYSAGSSCWSWGAFGQIPIGCGNGDGTIWEWDLNTANNLTAVSGAPTGCVGILVTAERFVFALGDGGDPRSIRWCDRDDRTQWTPASTNQAGGIDLKTEGEIRQGLQMRGESLVLTSKDAWRARYVGAPDVYEIERIGTGGSIGCGAGVSIGDRAFWMGDNSFFQYSGGYVSPLPCDVLDYFVSDIDTTFSPPARAEVQAWHNSEHHEVWWLYRSTTAASGVIDSYIAYNYVEGTWHYGRQPCSTIVDKVPFETAIGFRARSTILHNYDFASDPGFDLQGNWQISGGTLNLSAPQAAGASSPASTPGLIVLAQDYAVQFTVAGRSAGTLDVVFGASFVTVSTNAIHTFMATANATQLAISFISDATFDGNADNVLVRQAVILKFESGWVYDGTAPYAETGPLEISPGEKRAHVLQVIPDEQNQGELQFVFKHREYPTGSQTTEATVIAANPTDVRFAGREFTMKVSPVVTSGVAADWRCGTTRLDVIPGGKR